MGLAAVGQGRYVAVVCWFITTRRRWFGFLFLLLALGMLVWGQTWLHSRLRGVGFVVYWLVCLGWTLLALITALVDLRVTRRQLRREQLEMLKQALDDSHQGKQAGEGGQGKKPTKVRGPQSD